MTDRRPPYDQNETPDDVATLYSWANLHGAKYRDFSASRAQTREQVRLRVQQALEAEQSGAAHSIPEQSTQGQPIQDRPWLEQSFISQPGTQPSEPQVAPPDTFHPDQFQASPPIVATGHIDYRTDAERAAEVVRMAETARAAEEARQADLIAQYAARRAAEQAASEQADRQAAEEAARRHAELAAWLAANEEAKRQAELAAQMAAEQEAKRQAEVAAQMAAEQEAKRQAEMAAQMAAEEEAKRQAEVAAQMAAEEEAKRQTELAAQMAAEQEAKRQAEVAAQMAAEQEAKRQAEVAARLAADQEAKRQAEVAAQMAAEQEAKRQTELAAQMAAEQEAKRQAEVAAKLAAEQEAKHQAEVAAKQAAEQAARDASERAVHEAAQQAEAARQALAAQWAAQRAQAALPQAWPPLHAAPSPAIPVSEPQHAAPPQAPPPPFDYPMYAQAERQKPAASQPPRAPLREEGYLPPIDAWDVPAFQQPMQPPAQPTVHAESYEPVERPAWLTPERPDFPAQPAVPQAPEDTLQGSRDRLTSRWYALRGVFETVGAPVEAAPAPTPARAPVVAIFSLAGGVGKTSLVATMGRALSSRGERVLLVDTAAYGLLPFFFGAHDQRPGQLRTFSPPGTSTDAPIQMVTIDPDALGPESTNPEALCNEIGKYSRGVSRVIVDLATASGATTRRVLRMAPLVLVPMVPDMNSVVSVSSIDSFFQHNPNPAMKSAMPYYVLNQFDPSLPLHLDIREVLREQLGDRLLPFVVRRAPAVSEALAEGMTVMDYAPNSTVAEDFGTLAGWVKTQSAPASSSYRGVRWSER